MGDRWDITLGYSLEHCLLAIRGETFLQRTWENPDLVWLGTSFWEHVWNYLIFGIPLGSRERSLGQFWDQILEEGFPYWTAASNLPSTSYLKIGRLYLADDCDIWHPNHIAQTIVTYDMHIKLRRQLWHVTCISYCEDNCGMWHAYHIVLTIVTYNMQPDVNDNRSPITTMNVMESV